MTKKIIGWILFAVGAWMLISPQAILGLKQLKWMAKYAFSGEVLLAILVLMVAYYLIDFKAPTNVKKSPGH